MLTVKVKTGKVRLTIPLPYSVFELGITLLSSKSINKQLNKWTNEKKEENAMEIIIPRLDKKELRQIVRELKKHKGLELVNVKASDGTEVYIKI